MAPRRLAPFAAVGNGKPLLVLDRPAQFPGILFVEVGEWDVEVVGEIRAAEQQRVVLASDTSIRILGPCVPTFLELKEQVVGFEPALLLPLGGGGGVVGEGGGDGVALVSGVDGSALAWGSLAEDVEERAGKFATSARFVAPQKQARVRR